MKMPSFNLRRAVLGAVAVATVLLTIEAQYGQRDPGIVAVVRAAVGNVPSSARDNDVPVAAVKRFNPATPEIDPMSPNSWLPPPPPVPEVIVVPTVPPLPYSFEGKFMDAGKVSILLAKGSEGRVAYLGDVIDEVWKITRIENGMIEFLYIPMNKTQSLEFESTQ